METTSGNVEQKYDSSNAEKVLLKLAWENASRAESVALTEYWQPIDTIKSLYGTFTTTPTSPDQADDKNFKVEINDLADQADEMFALVKSLMNGREDRKCVAFKKADEKQVEVTKKTQDSLLRESDFNKEKSLAAIRFIKYHFSGLKVCRLRERAYKTERVEVPVFGPVDPLTGITIPGGGFTAQDLMLNGYTQEDIESGVAVQDKLAQQGLKFQGYADEFEQPDPNGNPVFTMILCTRTVEHWKDTVVGKAVDPRKLAVYDVNRTLDRQSSVHEFNYRNLAELKKCYPYNMAGFKEKAIQEPAAHQQPGNPQPNNTGGGASSGSPDFPIYEEVESWMELDFPDLIDGGRLSEMDIQGLAKRFHLPVQEFYVPGKWCLIHNKDRVLMDLYPSYLWDRYDYPWEIESWEPNEDRFCTHGFIHRISSAAAAVNKFRNFVMKNMRRMLNQPRIVSKRIQVSESELKKLDEENGTCFVNGQAADLQQDIMFHLVPDSTGPGFSMINYFEGRIRSMGVPAVLAGEGESDTATQADINDKRGQTIVNESFGRFVDMLMRFYKKHLGAMLISVTRGRMVKVAGEDGATFNEQWITPADLTDRMEMIPMISFNDIMEQQQSQFLIAMMNVFGQFLMPEEVRSIWKICLRKGGLSTHEIEEIEGSLGSYTDVKQEVDAMLADAGCNPVPRMDDPHPLCVAVATAALNQRLNEYQMLMLPVQPEAVGNLMKYIQTHEAMFQQQQMIAQLMTPQDGPNGKPKNEPPKDGDESKGRQSGQAASPADKGMMTNGGLTGTASPPAF